MFWTKTNPSDFLPKSVVATLKSKFSTDELDQLSRLSTPVEVPAGTKLTTEGTPGRQALVLVEGTASVFRNGAKIATINPGELIGEIALLSGEPRMATVIADSPATLYALSPREFATLMAQCPRFAKRVASGAVRRLSQI